MRSTATALDEYLDTAAELVRLIDADAVRAAADTLLDVHRRGGVVFACGNGVSASTASHFTSDLAKFVAADGAPRLRAVSLNDNVPLATAWTNDAGFDSAYAGQLDGWLSDRDALVVFSVHGGARSGSESPVSSNIVAALALARSRGARIVSVTGFDGGGAGEAADVHLNVPYDAEPLATPLIESLHVLIHHAICTELRSRGPNAASTGKGRPR